MTTAPTPPEVVTVPLVLTEAMARLLAENRSPASQFNLGELEEYDLGLPTSADPRFDDGTLFWCQGVSDAFLLRAYEDAAGHLTTLLHDPHAEGDEATRVVLSSRPYR
jgi:hypothetical protein